MKIPYVISLRVSKIVQKKQFVKDILNSIANSSGRALLVGGAVRDLFFNVPIKDLDFEVYGLTIEQLQKLLEQYGIVSLIGKSFGVLRLHGLDVDWSLPRTDSSGRHPVVAYDPTMSYEQAFIRRDLTINAMGIDMQSFELIDPFNGLQDLQDKILRAPDLTFFAQDPLRLLRVMQFTARFEMTVDEQLSQLCSTMDMSHVSCERIEQEFTKLFLWSRKPSRGLQWLDSIGKLHDFLPGLTLTLALHTKLNFTAELSFTDDHEKLVVMWAILVSFLEIKNSTDEFKQLDRTYKQISIDFMKNITRHEQLIVQVVNLVAYAQIIPASVTDRQIKWLAVWLAPELSIRYLAKFMVVRSDWDQATDLAERAEKLEVLDAPQAPLLTGKDLLDVAQGVELGKLVKFAYQQQIDQGITDRFVLKTIILEQD